MSINRARRLDTLLGMSVTDLVHEGGQLAFSWEHFDREYYTHRYRFPTEVRAKLGPKPTLAMVIRTLPKDKATRVRVVGTLVLAHELEEEEVALELAGEHPQMSIVEEHDHDEHEFVSATRDSANA